ncbi:hypothetical protein ACSSTO_14585 [Bacillus atrophaeus]|uniref:hypothetical protein n=1 Tax=Bacillus atrophaeus TaxID=1452 RepID=UPI003ED9D3A6
MLSFFILLSLTMLFVCFIVFTALYCLSHHKKGSRRPFQKAAEDTVDTLLIQPLSWAVTAVYFMTLLIIIAPLYHLRRYMQTRR